MIFRSLLRHCPRCGDRHAWFHSWFKQGDRCLACGLQRTRNTQGQELGSMTIALVVNICWLVAASGIAIAFTVPDVPVLTLFVVLATAEVLVAVLTWPITHTVWMAIDLRVRPMGFAEIDEAEAWLNTSAP